MKLQDIIGKARTVRG